MWWVYMLECSDGTFYTGIARDVARRIEEHNTSKKGARYTRGRRPVRLLHQWEAPDHAAALKEEYRIKRLSKHEKQNWVGRQL